MHNYIESNSLHTSQKQNSMLYCTNVFCTMGEYKMEFSVYTTETSGD